MFWNDDRINGMAAIPLSATTTACCIDEMTSDVRLKQALSLEMNKCRDMSKDTELLAFVQQACGLRMKKDVATHFMLTTACCKGSHPLPKRGGAGFSVWS